METKKFLIANGRTVDSMIANIVGLDYNPLDS